MPGLSFLHSDKFLPVQSGLGMLSLLLACVGLSRMDVLASFSRVSSVLCFGCHVVSSFFFGETLLRDVTGKALLSSALQSLNSLLRDVTALARS